AETETMGETTKYKLPWPELTDSADGPLGYQNLATKTEAALVTESTNKLLLQTSGGGKNYTTTKTGQVTITFPTPFKSGTYPAITVHVLSPNSGAYVVNLDGSLVSQGAAYNKFAIRFFFASTGGPITAARTIAIVWTAIGIHA